MPKTNWQGVADMRPTSDEKQNPTKGPAKTGSQPAWNRGGETPERPKSAPQAPVPGQHGKKGGLY